MIEIQSQRPDISVVIPCYNEEDNVQAICAAVIAQLEPLGISFDVIFIDNDSTDRTVDLVRGLCAADARVRLIVNTRNYGQMRSPTHGIYQARGRAVIGMCADFQDPPELLPEFVRRWQSGVDIVLALRKSETKNGPMLRMMRGLSYWLARNFGDYPILPDATGFGLYDARVVQATRLLSEPEPFFRGMLVETGYKLETIAFLRPPRAGGKSKNNFFALLDFAMSALAGSSKRLLRVPLYIGVFGALMTLVMLLGGTLAFFLDKPIAGWFIAAIVQAELALLFGFLGLLGDNVRIISERTRGTPLVLERERVNFPSDY
ncbi:glycosyltransferase involved in cell wall biosynthesis [Sphingomonas sp. SORGH_AS870]|uniref:glycosyltransferase family 2 protein n=1 Tax=Sphingomonas sp. SORGH_AS_0870 TaxID=3041801 RepID=UPI00285CC51E|nr:glycosyltransferase family 2 protein [Sphingomonas sp. SORGH_AS_0870]MDR6144258.1 glycosyltransferase involved in cell wall biosynthesis [Sphingomonas sp. SORGH_AS_0870]